MKRRLALPLIFIVFVALGSLLATIAVGNSPELGLDLQGGASVVLQPPEGVEGGEEVLDQAIEVIRNRVDALGVAEPEINRQGDAIVVSLPGVNNTRRAVDIVGQTAELRFRPVLSIVGETPLQLPPVLPTDVPFPEEVPGAEEAPPTEEAPPAEEAPPTTEGDALDLRDAQPVVSRQETTTTTAAEGAETTDTTPAPDTSETTETTVEPDSTDTTAPAATTTTLPPDVETTPREEDLAEEPVILPGLVDEDAGDGEEPPIYSLGPAFFRGNAVDDAQARLRNVEWAVDLGFTDEGADAFNDAAGQCFRREPTCPTSQLAIVLDGVVQSAPVIQQETFPEGRADISGSFDESGAKDLALVLRYGALPVQLENQSTSTVSPSLGRDSLRAGLLAGAIGTALVLTYMILYYRALGVVVVLGLAVWFSLQWSIISYLGVSRGLALSLAGATGIIVSVGVTVDSYVVYFERLKDEVRAGRTVRSSVDRGFKRAFRTILIADTSAFIGAATLYFLTIGPVRGFAFFLGLSTLLDVVVAWFFTRPLVALLGRRQFFTTARFLGVSRGLGVRQPERLTAPA